MCTQLHERLKLARERRRLSLATIARQWGVREQNLELIERNRFEELPTGLYGRNAVRASEKEFLADQIMVFDNDPHDSSAEDHLLTNREGAAGGRARHPRDVDVVGVWHKAGDRAPAQQDDAATHEMNAFIHLAVW